MTSFPRAPEPINEPKADVLIVLALREEFDYLLESLDIPAQPIDWKYPYYIFESKTASARSIKVAVGFFDKMDNSYASTFTLELLQEVKPELLVNLGISGLIDDELHLGDVIIAESSENITYRGKIIGTNQSDANDNKIPSLNQLVLGGDAINTFQPFHRIFANFDRANRAEWIAWTNRALVVFDTELTLDERKRLEDQSLISLPPKLAVGPVVTQPWVGANKELKTWLKNSGNRNFLAMDTESWGVLQGARSYSPDLRTLLVRAISDPADERKKELDNIKGGAIRKWAVSNAAHLLMLFIEHYWGDSLSPNKKTASVSSLVDAKGQLEAELHKTCVRYFLDPYYDNESRIQDHGYDSYGDLFKTISNANELPDKKFLEHLIDAATSSNIANPLFIEGMPGTGKTSLLSILYWLTRHKHHENTAFPLPVFINLHHYNETSKGSTRSVNQEAQAVAQMGVELISLKNFISAFPHEPLLIIIDGFDEFARFKEASFKYLSELLQKSLHYRIIGSREAVNSAWRDISGEAPYTVYSLQAININDSRIPELIRSFINIWAPASASDALKHNLAERLESAVRQAKIKWIDLFTLSLIANSRSATASSVPQNLSRLLDDYCRRYLRERLKGWKKPEEMLSFAATIAFESQIERQSFSSTDGDELILWDLIQKHSRICDYLTAYHITHEFLGLARKKFFQTEKLRYVYPHRINRLAKELINRDSKEQTDFAQILNNFLGVKRVQDYAKAQACYLAGRLNDPQAKRIALEALQKYKARTLERESQRKGKTLRDYHTEQSNDRLLLDRTIYISMAYLGDAKAEAEYIDLLFSNPRMDLVNRGFHLEYYGDQEYDPTRPLTNSDQLKECPKTFHQLLQNLSSGPNENPIFEIELFTLCSLAQKRHAAHSLPQIDRLKILELLMHLTHAYKIKHDKLQIYVRMLIKHLSKQDFDVSDVFSGLYSIKEKKRMGWANRNIPNGESVADHSYGAFLIGLLFLPESIESNTEYSKSEILRMLLIHDLAESITGDIVPEQSNESSKRKEREVYEEIGLLGTYDQIADMSEVYTLWDRFEDRKTINGIIAKEIDKLENLIQLFVYQPRYNIKNFDSWRTELLDVIKTDVGKSILHRLEGMLNTELLRRDEIKSGEKD